MLLFMLFSVLFLGSYVNCGMICQEQMEVIIIDVVKEIIPVSLFFSLFVGILYCMFVS